MDSGSSTNDFIRFVCDNTVGKLARLLRSAGFNTAYVSEDDPAQVMRLSREEKRKIISRNSKYGKLTLASDFYHVKQDKPLRQFEQLLIENKMVLPTGEYFSRCLDCNSILVKVPKTSVKNEVLPYVFTTQDKFCRCPDCRRLFWRGTHVRAMLKKLDEIREKISR